MAIDRKTVVYKGEDGVNYVTWVDAAWLATAGNDVLLGSNVTPATASMAILPKSIKPRYVIVKGATSEQVKRLPIYDKTATLWTGSATSIVLPTYRGAAATETFNVIGLAKAERNRRKSIDNPA